MRQLFTRVACIALVAAVVLTFTPAAHAQRGLFRGGGNSGGYMPGYGYGPYSGFGQGYGYGGLGYNTYPGFNTYQYGYSNVPLYSNYAPGYSATPGYYYGSPNVVTPNYQMTPNYRMYPNAMTGMPANVQGQTQSMYAAPSNAALIAVIVPADAQLWIDNQQSQQTGPQRQIVTPATLEPGKTYHYTLKAQWTENGQPVVREKSVDFQAGGQVTVDFTKPQQ